MKVLMILCVLTIVASVYGTPTQRGCVYGPFGECFRECEEGTHSYITGCGPLTPEATCDNPNPVTDMRRQMCDYSACYCDSPTVRDSVSGKCVKLEDCPPKDEKKYDEEKNDIETLGLLIL